MDEHSLPDNPRDPRARWSAALRVPVGATADDTRASFLRGLPGDEFLPSAERVAAANALAGAGAATGHDEDAERLLRDEVDAFAARCWSLAPAERRSTWTDLSHRASHAGPVRLRELEPGLDVSVVPLADPAAEELAALVRELFVLPPRARAIARNKWLLERAGEVEKWRAAHAALGRDAPTLAALEPTLGAALDYARRAAVTEFVEGATAEPIRHTRMSNAASVAGYADRAHRRGEGGANAGWTISGGVLAMIILFRLIAALVSSNTSSNNSPSAERPGYQVTSAPEPKIRVKFTAEEVAEFEQFERDEAAGRPAQQPLAYAGWRLVGRPRAVPGAGAPKTPGTWSFDREQVRECQDYERKVTNTRTTVFSLWLLVGKPTKPGSYSLLSDPQPPR